MKTFPTLLDIKYTDQTELNENVSLLVEIIEKIKKFKTYDEAEYYFALLAEIQSILAKLVFANNLDVTDTVLKFYW